MMMNRSGKYIEYSREIADSLRFLQNAKDEKEQLKIKLNEYVQLINISNSVFLKFPALILEIQSGLTIQQFNTDTAPAKVEGLKKTLVKLTYMHDMLDEIGQINNPVLEEKVSLNTYKTKFNNGVNNLVFRTVDTLHFEMQQFEQIFKKALVQLNDDKQKREKLRSLMGQDLPVITQFSIIEIEIRKMIEGETKGGIGADYVITHYPSIRDSLNKINEFSKYFSVLSRDYMLVLSGSDLQIFQNTKKTISLQTLSGEFLKLNAKATEYKNKIIKLDTLRNGVNNLQKEVNEKIADLSPNHQIYVREEMMKARGLLFDQLSTEFEKAETKINAIREVLKKEFKSNDQKATEALYIRQTISRYENSIWQEDLTLLFEELNAFVNGSSAWTKDEFSNATQKFIRQKNEAMETVKSEFSLFFEKKRVLKNRFEKIENTKSSKKELEALLNEMSSFKPLKNIFYKFIK